MSRMTLTKRMNLKSWHGGPTFGHLNSLDSDEGPNRMHLINLKSGPWAPTFDSGPDFRFIRSIRFGPGTDSNASNQSTSAGLGGGTFDSLGPLDSGQGPHRMNLNESKVLALRQTLEKSLASV